ncbi:MAG: lytic transglycosylase domain-containing protein [Bacteroidota bacterium]|nr:lytic transglycosylase domain-containing protein [Bacteroidota bacterium]
MKKYINIFQFLVIIALAGIIIAERQPQIAQVEAAPVYNAALPFQQLASYKVFTFEIPKELDLAGEQVPLDDNEVLQRFDREIHVNTYWNSSTIFLMKRSNQWFPHLAPILEEHNIPKDFLYLSLIESGLMNVKSPAGASGFWQLMEATAKELGLEVNEEVDERYNAKKSTEAACKYLANAHKKFGNWTNVAASYNMGMAGLQRSLMEQKADSYYDLLLNDETSRYIFRILAIKEIMENPARYGYNIPSNHLYQQEKLTELVVDKNIPDLTDFAIAQGINYKVLKNHNPWLRKKSLTIKKPGQAYTLLLPEKRFSLQNLVLNE